MTDIGDATHYDIGGVLYPRVSTILAVINNPGINTWRLKKGAKKADEISKVATTFGTRLHAALSGELQAWAKDDEVERHVAAWREWEQAHILETVSVERLCVSDEYGYAGTADRLVILRKDGALALLDFKSSKTRFGKNGWSPLHALQLSGYALALQEDGLAVERRVIIQLPRNEPGRVIPHEYPNHVVDRRAWSACLALYQYITAYGPV